MMERYIEALFFSASKPSSSMARPMSFFWSSSS
jgi:hypothetical protein